MTSAHKRDIVSSSQNFVLRFSDDSTVEDTYNLVASNKKTNEDDVIVISDSSCSSSPRRYEMPALQTSTSKKKIKYPELNICEIASLENKKDKLNPLWTKFVESENKSSDKRYIGRNSKLVNKAFYTSDEITSSGSNAGCSENIKDRTAEYGIQGSFESTTFAKQREYNTSTSKKHEMYTIKQTSDTNTPYHTARSESTASIATRLNKFTVKDTPPWNNTGKVRLTKKDTHKIFQNIMSTQVVYNSPRQKQKMNAVINESLDADEDTIHPAISFINNREINYNSNSPDVIETSLKNDIIPDSQIDSSHEMHINKFPDVEKEENLHRPLSERKKIQIAEWLMSSRYSRSDSSCSNIPATGRNSRNSGNSSLERLERDYETPNNRGRVNMIRIDERQTAVINYDKTIQPGSPCQTTLDRFIQRSKNGNVEFRTPERSTFSPKLHADEKTAPSKEKMADIKNCADVLDKLYGKSWRNKATVVLPTTEPRKTANQVTNRPIQTERKPSQMPKNKYLIDSDSDEFDWDKYNYETRKKTQKKYKKRNSFINDESLSSNNSETIYHTALTNFRISTNSAAATQCSKPTPVPTLVKRLVSICDSNTEDELDDKSSRSSKNLRRRKLSFSNDSETSEFDPGDYVPPKYISKKESKTLNPRPKATFKYKSTVQRKCEKYYSFLASLSNKIPMSNAHPDAKKYRLNYKNRKDELCKELYDLYNDKVFDNQLSQNMLIEWNIRMRGTAGYCYNKKTTRNNCIDKSSRIVLSTKILDTPDRLRDTLIHEMCHAAAWQINGTSDGHGPFWTAWADKAMKTFPELPKIRRCHDYEIKTKFTYKCTQCGYSIGRHSKSLDTEKKRCGHCYGKFELLINKTTKTGTVQVQTPKREPSGFALYVKQNYNCVKKEKSSIRHADVMKILGQQFSALKVAKINNPIAITNDAGTPG